MGSLFEHLKREVKVTGSSEWSCDDVSLYTVELKKWNWLRPFQLVVVMSR